MSSWWEQHDGDGDGDGVMTPHETGLLMIKPDNLERPSSLPGHIIDMITTTGLHLKGCKVFSMTPAMGEEFYGFLEGIFVKKLKGKVEKQLRTALSPQYMNFEITDGQFADLADVLKESNAKNEVAEIMNYMTGIDPRTTQLTEEEKQLPGPARCFGLLYSGERAIEMIRTKLGNTNPDEAEVGSVRSDYGKDVMRNGAHASDAVDRAMVERQIVGLVGDEQSEEVAIINKYLDTLA
jgi:nucleoside diphosphate kinase